MSPLNAKLYSVGAVLVRQRRHNVWRLPNGRTFVSPKTPSDLRSVRNSLAQLRRMLNG